MEEVVNHLIVQNRNLNLRLSNLEFIVQTYHEFKKETAEFTKHLQQRVKELDKNRAKDSILDK